MLRRRWKISKNRRVFVCFRDVKAGSVAAPSILWGWVGGGGAGCGTALASSSAVTRGLSFSGTFYMSCAGTAADPARRSVLHQTAETSAIGAARAYYLLWFHVARNGSRIATVTSSREGPQDSDLPAATAACSSLLSAPTTGASVPT